MIRPDKYLDLDTCVIRVSAEVVRALNENGPMTLDLLEDWVVAEIGIRARVNLLASVLVCHAIGVVDYEPEIGALFLQPILDEP